VRPILGLTLYSIYVIFLLWNGSLFRLRTGSTTNTSQL